MVACDQSRRHSRLVFLLSSPEFSAYLGVTCDGPSTVVPVLWLVWGILKGCGERGRSSPQSVVLCGEQVISFQPC